MKYIGSIVLLFLIMGCNAGDNKLPRLSYFMDLYGTKSFYTIEFDGFTDQFGEDFRLEKTDGKVYVASFFFTRCPSICPPMNSALRDLANDVQDEDFILISHTIDPANDSIQALRDYWERMEVKQGKWYFLRSSEEKTKEQAKKFMTNFKPLDDGTDFYHSSYLGLVGKNGYIRGFYNSLLTEEIDRLKEDLAVLLEEKPN